MVTDFGITHMTKLKWDCLSDRSWLHPHTHSLYGQSWRRKSCDLLLLLRWWNEGLNKWRIKVQEAEETEHWKKRKLKQDKKRVKRIFNENYDEKIICLLHFRWKHNL